MLEPSAPKHKARKYKGKDSRQIKRRVLQNNLEILLNDVVEAIKTQDAKTKEKRNTPLRLLFLNEVTIIEMKKNKIETKTKIFFRDRCFFIVSIFNLKAGRFIAKYNDEQANKPMYKKATTLLEKKNSVPEYPLVTTNRAIVSSKNKLLKNFFFATESAKKYTVFFFKK